MELRVRFQKLSKNCSFLDFSEFSKNLHFSVFEFLRHAEGPLSNINQHINTLWVLLLKINTCCFCCRQLLILSKCEKNWRHKWKLGAPMRERQKFRQKFLREALPIICCQLVISLKSLSWKHMWSSKSIFKNCRKNAHFWIFQNYQKISIFQFLSF